MHAIHNRRPPPWLTNRLLNPLVLQLARTRLAPHLPVAVLRVTGRRSGRRFDVPLGVHRVGEQRLVFTNAVWRLNFRGGASAELLAKGHRSAVHVSLVEDPAEVGVLFRTAFRAGVTPQQIGMRIDTDHEPGDGEFAAARNVLVIH
jgi:hypothetical protein